VLCSSFKPNGYKNIKLCWKFQSIIWSICYFTFSLVYWLCFESKTTGLILWFNVDNCYLLARIDFFDDYILLDCQTSLFDSSKNLYHVFTEIFRKISQMVLDEKCLLEKMLRWKKTRFKWCRNKWIETWNLNT
jgi:hypothetical protein